MASECRRRFLGPALFWRHGDVRMAAWRQAGGSSVESAHFSSQTATQPTEQQKVEPTIQPTNEMSKQIRPTKKQSSQMVKSSPHVAILWRSGTNAKFVSPPPNPPSPRPQNQGFDSILVRASKTPPHPRPDSPLLWPLFSPRLAPLLRRSSCSLAFSRASVRRCRRIPSACSSFSPKPSCFTASYASTRF